MTVSATEPSPYLRFRRIVNIFLGAMVGSLVVYPFALTQNGSTATLLLLFGLAGGALTGYRRRESHVFFYFALVCCCILSALIASELKDNPTGAAPGTAESPQQAPQSLKGPLAS